MYHLSLMCLEANGEHKQIVKVVLMQTKPSLQIFQVDNMFAGIFLCLVKEKNGVNKLSLIFSFNISITQRNQDCLLVLMVEDLSVEAYEGGEKLYGV